MIWDPIPTEDLRRRWLPRDIDREAHQWDQSLILYDEQPPMEVGFRRWVRDVDYEALARHEQALILKVAWHVQAMLDDDDMGEATKRTRAKF